MSHLVRRVAHGVTRGVLAFPVLTCHDSRSVVLGVRSPTVHR